MPTRIIKVNQSNNELYCLYSKEKIELGEKYLLIFDWECDHYNDRTYKIENMKYLDKEDDE